MFLTDCFPEALALLTGFTVLSLLFGSSAAGLLSRSARLTYRIHCIIFALRFLCGYSIIVNGIVFRFLSASSAGSNTKRFPPASVPSVRQEQPQENSYLKVSSTPGQRTDKFRHSPALENTRLWCLVGQTFLRSSIQGRFPVSTSPPARQ